MEGGWWRERSELRGGVEGEEGARGGVGVGWRGGVVGERDGG